MDSEQIAFLTVAELAHALRERHLTSLDATHVCLDRIAKLDGELNAFITVTEAPAREQAARADSEIRNGIDRGPLHGVPVAVKDLIDVAGIETSWATRAAPPARPARHAALVANLERAGAVIVGKTNLLEFAYGAVHADFGQTNNPWDSTRTSGGSSGGSAAAVAAGMAYAAVGTDTGGSIRIPAAYCGISGIKPSFDRVPTDGVFPLSPTLDHAGPLARTPACAAAALAAMAGEEVQTLTVDLKGLRIGVLAAQRDDPAVRSGVRDAFVAACDALAAAGATLHDLWIDDLAGADAALPEILLPEASLIHAERLAGHPDGYAPATRLQLEQGFDVRATGYLQALRYRTGLRARFDVALQGADAILTLAAPWVAPPEDPSVIDGEGQAEMRFHAPWNLTGLPAVVVPCGIVEELPVGLQLGGPMGSDFRLLAMAEAALSAVAPTGRPPLPPTCHDGMASSEARGLSGGPQE